MVLVCFFLLCWNFWLIGARVGVNDESMEKEKETFVQGSSSLPSPPSKTTKMEVDSAGDEHRDTNTPHAARSSSVSSPCPH